MMGYDKKDNIDIDQGIGYGALEKMLWDVSAGEDQNKKYSLRITAKYLPFDIMIYSGYDKDKVFSAYDHVKRFIPENNLYISSKDAQPHWQIIKNIIDPPGYRSSMLQSRQKQAARIEIGEGYAKGLTEQQHTPKTDPPEEIWERYCPQIDLAALTAFSAIGNIRARMNNKIYSIFASHDPASALNKKTGIMKKYRLPESAVYLKVSIKD